MESEDNSVPPSQTSQNIEETEESFPDIDNLASNPPKEVQPYKKNFIEEKSYQARIAESQESTRSNLAKWMFGIYSTTILLCFLTVAFGLDKGERKEVLTIIITSQGTLIGSAIGFYFAGK